jgi:guanylate kinase
MKFIVTLTGPSCSGKTTLKNALVANEVADKLISFTTRERRSFELHGVDYYFKTTDQVKEMMMKDQVAQSVFINQNTYGCTIDEIDRCLALNNVVVVVVEPTGVSQFRQRYAHSNDIKIISYFITNTAEKLIARMLTRFIDDVDHSTKTYASRIYKLINTEIHWHGQSSYWYRDVFLMNDHEDSNVVIAKIKSDILKVICSYS